MLAKYQLRRRFGSVQKKTISEKCLAEVLDSVGKFAMWHIVGGELESVYEIRKFARKQKMKQTKKR
jgi:hypothetical protein